MLSHDVLDARTKLRAMSYTTHGQDPHSLLSMYDKDRSGELSWEEFTAAVRKGGKVKADGPHGITDAKLRKLFAVADKDRSGTVSIAEMAMFVWGNTDLLHEHDGTAISSTASDDDVPPPVGHHFRPQDARQPEPAYGVGGNHSTTSSEEVSSRLTIEDYLMSDLRLPNHAGLDQYATSSFIPSPDREPAPRAASPEAKIGRATRQARCQALKENLAREKGRRKQPPPTGRRKKPPPTQRELKRMTRDRPWAEPPATNRSRRPRSAPPSRPAFAPSSSAAAAEKVVERTRRTASRLGDVTSRRKEPRPSGGPATAREHRAKVSAPTFAAPRPQSARRARDSDAPPITIQLKAAQNKLKVQSRKVKDLQKETSRKDRVISELKEQVRIPSGPGQGRGVRVAKQRESERQTERKTTRDTISKLKGDLKDARARALRAEATVASSARELKKAKEMRVSSAKQLRVSLQAETAKRQRAEEELKSAKKDISKLTRQLRAEEKRSGRLEAELSVERQRRMELLELSRKHGLDVRSPRKQAGGGGDRSRAPGDGSSVRASPGPMPAQHATQAQGQRTPGAGASFSLLDELRERRLSQSGGGRRANVTLTGKKEQEMSEAVQHIAEARARVAAREHEIREREQAQQEARERSMRWAAARDAADDPSLAGGVGGNTMTAGLSGVGGLGVSLRPEPGMAARRMSGEMAAAVGERQATALDESEEFSPFVVKQTEMQHLMTRLRNQAAKKLQNPTNAIANDAMNDTGDSSGLNISVGMHSHRQQTQSGAAVRRPLSSYHPLDVVGEPGTNGSTSSSDFGMGADDGAKVRLVGIKAAGQVRHARP